MGSSENERVLAALLVGADIDLESRIGPMIIGAGFPLFSIGSVEQAAGALSMGEARILLVSSQHPKVSEECKEARRIAAGKPIQIIIIANARVESGFLSNALNFGVDDFLREPFSSEQLELRLKAAGIRLKAQEKLFEEREYFKQAVRQEENLSSKILDEHVFLKHTLDNIVNVQKNLEATNQKLSIAAKQDSLSRLLNRASLFECLRAEVDRACVTTQDLSGIMLDIDEFKSINDTYGHQLGDQVIQGIGKCLKSQLRKEDRAGRYGGEEFFIVLPASNSAQALGIAERFRAELQKVDVRTPDNGRLVISGSLGVAQYIQGETVEQWIERADRAMYRAKRMGRNRVELGDN